ncbi:LytTR family DNA-binding domain-containing protein [Clostridium sp. CM028]|uniref:LytR/AlgR family response regulator transcription factor n=1 Tax=unclassified Clostridium TaxID=2614128 RepID=UPI001C0DE187|nr:MULTISPECIES: LytTR family DNA-binding domain-containing protein [unclassified Clostridium]MBU3093331.1 LytTR family DNA-binding domain-containing protein [Clostridium sp. CF011]MBW9147270.1 LytTR family DNA-binding domain-containing protein [Clostridium sp. CM027]MBW9150442.1 LytTR family DNA-binding domain-containing protein [Clostridium sp. CM028]UVE41787.1 LytTR family DNA-binding domain-containing protein [Clostridium sp. CM027]WAG70787.1 LytTR family DNA-binding domain-containing prot
MLGIIICEDNEHQKKQIENIIKDELINLKIDLEIELSTRKYEEVIAYVKSNKERIFIYFLDVDLKDQISGIELAKIIRKYDSKGYIVFITAHSEMSLLTFKYKVQALDYILKGDIKSIKNKINECILESCNDYNKNNTKEKVTIAINLGNRITNFSLCDMLFFETTTITHKLRLHTNNGQFEFYGKLKDFEVELNSCFYKAHKSYLVNITNINSIDKQNRIIYFVNDETCFVSAMYLKGLIKKCLA